MFLVTGAKYALLACYWQVGYFGVTSRFKSTRQSTRPAWAGPAVSCHEARNDPGWFVSG